MKNVHLLPTDKPSRLFIDIEDNKLKITIPIGGEHMMNQNIYITNDEEIKEGDYCISHLNIIDEGKIHNSQTIFNPKTKEHLILLQSCKKIILTTDQSLIQEGVQAIDDEFLIWLVKNSNCEEVEVKTRYLHYYKTGETFISFSKTPDFSSRNMQCIKIEPRYEIIIPKEEPKQENSEDFGLPKFGTKEFNDLASGLFGGKPKQENCCTPVGQLKRYVDCYGCDRKPKQEIWKDIPNYEGLYQVSNFGNVKSLERYVKGKVENRLQKENILSKRLVGELGNQYYAVTLCNNKNRKQIKVSVLVAMVFLNHIPNGYVGFTIDHIDNNPLNNNVNNLQVITKRENSSKDRKGISKYTGVTFNKKTNKWRSQIWINGKNKTLGSFDDELEAHRVYQKELQQHLKSQ